MIPSNTKQENRGGEKGTSGTAAGTGLGQVSTRTISLPKAGGAIRGIGEKFSVNPATGALTVPIFTSPGRSDFYPQLSLVCDSGSGNGSLLCWLIIKQLGFSRDRSNPASLDQSFFCLLQRRAFLEWRRAASCLARVIDESDKFSAL